MKVRAELTPSKLEEASTILVVFLKGTAAGFRSISNKCGIGSTSKVMKIRSYLLNVNMQSINMQDPD